MKKFLKIGLPILLCATIIFSLPVFAKQARETATLAYNNIKIFINGEELSPKDAAGNTVEPFIINGTTYLPVRAVSNAFDKNVSWDAETQSVYISDKVVYNKMPYSAYNEKVSEYIEAATVGWDTFCVQWDLDDDSISSESMRDYYHYDNKLLAYTLADLDENGVPELILANLSEEKIYEVYTINNDLLIRLFYGYGYRSRLHILPDGKFLGEGSSSAFESSMEIYSIKHGCSPCTEESYYFDTREDDALDYYREGTEISVEEYGEKIDALKAQAIFDEFDWVVFAQ